MDEHHLTTKIMHELVRHRCKNLKDVRASLEKLEQPIADYCVYGLVNELIEIVEKDEDLLLLYKHLRDLRENLQSSKPLGDA